MNERNRETLDHALKGLPTYEPPRMVWDNLQRQLDQAAAERILQEAIGRLPTYEPAASVWSHIETGLIAPPSAPSKLRRLYAPLAAAAATMAVLLIALNIWSNRQPAPQIAYTIEESTFSPPTIVADWNADEELINQVVSLFEKSPKAAGSTNYASLREELTELNEAREQLEMIMQKYGQDPKTIQELKEIELERNSVIKQMASLI